MTNDVQFYVLKSWIDNSLIESSVLYSDSIDTKEQKIDARYRYENI